MQNRPISSPLNPLPWIVWLLALPLVAMELVISAGETGLLGDGALGWRLQAVTRFELLPQIAQFTWNQGGWIPFEPWRFVTYVLVHGNFMNALFGVAILLALGKMVGEVFRWWAVLLLWLAGAVTGGLVYALLPGQAYRLIGSFPAVYALIGAFTYLQWMRLDGAGSSRYRAFSLIAMLMFVQLLFGLLFGGGMYWVAELTGFVVGFLLSFLVSPGGWSRLRYRLRQR